MNGAEFDQSMVLRSKDLADLAGTTIRALRHYHQTGLLREPPRDNNGYRRYRVTDLVRVLRIRQFVNSGVPLRRVAELLKEDTTIDDTVLGELDQELDRKAHQIAAQRDTLARLRRSHKAALPPKDEAPSDTMGKTRELEQQLWTLIGATGTIDSASLADFEAVLAAVDEETIEWYREFERLENHTDIADATAAKLADKLVGFYRTLASMVGSPDTAEENPTMELVSSLLEQQLSPAQHRVWTIFLARIEGSTD